MPDPMTKNKVIETLNLEPHPSEGGYFRRSYTSETECTVNTGKRKTLSSIFYLLTDDSPVGYLHKNQSDIVHYFHKGSAITYYILCPQGKLETIVLGPDLDSGQQLQLTVKGGYWKASQLKQGEYGLISEAVSPGFEYEDMEMADDTFIQETYPAIYDAIKRFIRKSV